MSAHGEDLATLESRRIEMEKRMNDMAFARLTELRLDGQLCDVVIRVGDVEFNAHKIILCSCSQYFCTLFTGAWSTTEKKTHNIPGVSPEMMHLIINYAYNRSVAVTIDNVGDALEAADQFMVPGIIHTCRFFLEEQLCITNCIGIWRLVDFYTCTTDLSDKVFSFILHHFEEIHIVSEELLELPVEKLVTIIESDCLNVRKESTVLEVVFKWINHLPDERRDKIAELLPKVRLGLMTIHYFLENVINNPLIRNTPTVKDAVNNFTEFRAFRRSSYIYSNLQSRPRLPSSILLVTGGKNNSLAASCIEAYDYKADYWVTLSTVHIERAHHGTAVLNNFVYLIGGCNRETDLDTVDKFDLVTGTLHPVASMTCCRCYLSVVVHNGCIYAMGGSHGQTSLSSAEIYRPETDQWTSIAPMRTKRCGAGATTLNGKVYVCGGFNGYRNLSSAECYDPDTNMWTSIARMSLARTGHGVAAYNGRIYAVGGTNTGYNPLCSAEAYNPQTHRWTHLPSMSIPRCYFGIEVVNEQLFVVGGYGVSGPLASLECYDEEAGMWYRSTSIETPRSGLGCCALHGLYNMAEKLFSRGPLAPNVEESAGGSM